MRFRNVIFDLDGTLVDSLPGIEASARFAAARCAPERELPPMRPLIGPPIRRMFAILWPDLTDEELGRLVAEFREHYDSEGCLLSPLYEGVPETLGRLQSRGTRMFVLTNKPRLPAGKILAETGIAAYFSDVVTPDGANPFVSKADAARVLQQRYSLGAGETLVMGDGIDDSEAAVAGGFKFVLAGYGYGSARTRAEGVITCVAESFSAIATIVL